MTNIYVVGCVTDGGVGAFEWDYDRVRIDQVWELWLARQDADVSEVKAYSLDDLGLANIAPSADQVTGALSASPEMWEPLEGEGR
jgi:hypothetical protein